MLFIKELRKDYTRFDNIIDSAKDIEPLEIKLLDFLSWNKNTNFTIRFDTIANVELQVYGFNSESLYNLDDKINSLDFDKISTSNKRLFLKFCLEDLLNMYVLQVRNCYFGAMVEILIDYPRFVEESCNIFGGNKE